MWDFGSAARHHQLYNPWLDHTPGPATPEGAGADRGPGRHLHAARRVPPATPGIAEDVARKIAAVLREHGLAGAPVGIDVAEMPVLAALPRPRASTTVDGQQVFLEARRIKTPDEISLLTQACSMVDAAYDELYEFLRPGRARERVRGPGQQGPLRPGQRVRRGRQRDLRASAARRTRTCTPTG